jgi:hypothetical protein
VATFDVFRPELKLAAAGVPDILCDRIAWRTVNDFLQRTEAWRVELTAPLDYVAGATNYDPAPQLPAGASASRIVSVRWRPASASTQSYTPWGAAGQFKTLPFFTREKLTAQFPGWETDTDIRPWRYTAETSGSARLHPIASATVTGAIEMTVACTVGMASTFPDWMYIQYLEELLPGMLGRLYSMPKRDWTDPKLAAANLAMYEKAIIEATSSNEKDFGRPNLEVAYGGI